jgi:hypothetical protein
VGILKKAGFPAVLAVLWIFSSSCAFFSGKNVNGETVADTPPVLSTPTDTPPALEKPGPAAAAERRVVLIRGNAWVTGIPGFGENALSALLGEYRIDEGGTGEAAARLFRVWLSREPLYFAEPLWQNRNGTPASRVLQQIQGDRLLAAVRIDGGPEQGEWIAVFQFSTANFAAGAGEIDPLIGAYITRFLYFLSLTHDISELSLPAIVTF